MDIQGQNFQERSEEQNPEEENQNDDQKVIERIEKYSGPAEEIIAHRLEELRNEWDIEKYIEVHAASAGLAGILFGTFFSKKWFLLTGLATGCMLQQGAQGWNPLVPVYRAMGIRTREEIEEEIHALKVVRGDYDSLSKDTPASEILEHLRE